MPHLDGVSAAALIRQFDKDTPIIAMTSNIRSDDIQTYFDNGKAPIISNSDVILLTFQE